MMHYSSITTYRYYRPLLFVLVIIGGMISLKAQTSRLPCAGVEKKIVLVNNTPYLEVKVGNVKGLFLIDHGSTGSSIDPKAFSNGTPLPVAGTRDKFAQFDFFGVFSQVTLTVRDYSTIKGVKQAGIIGTDFLSLNPYMLDYENKLVIGGQNFNCSDSILLASGFHAVSAAGYYSNDLNKLQDKCTFNIPTVPVRVGPVAAVAQLDPGLDDHINRRSVNINRAFFEALQSAGVLLIRKPENDLTLTTCVGINEPVKAYTLGKDANFSIMGKDGQPVLITPNATLFLKETPAEASSCSGIGTWKIPAAQIGASFLSDSKAVIFDPLKSIVWFYSK